MQMLIHNLPLCLLSLISIKSCYQFLICAFNQNLEDLKNEIDAWSPPHGSGLKTANILFLGPVGAGKSSFFNTISSIFRGHVTGQAVCGSAEQSITSKVCSTI
jgi:predicted GTPase